MLHHGLPSKQIGNAKKKCARNFIFLISKTNKLEITKLFQHRVDRRQTNIFLILKIFNHQASQMRTILYGKELLIQLLQLEEINSLKIQKPQKLFLEYS